MHSEGNSKFGHSSMKFGVFTEIVRESFSKFALTSYQLHFILYNTLAMPPKINLTDSLEKSLKADPIIDKIVFPVAGPQFGEIETILNGQNATTLLSLQKICWYILVSVTILGNFITPIF